MSDLDISYRCTTITKNVQHTFYVNKHKSAIQNLKSWILPCFCRNCLRRPKSPLSAISVRRSCDIVRIPERRKGVRALKFCTKQLYNFPKIANGQNQFALLHDHLHFFLSPIIRKSTLDKMTLPRIHDLVLVIKIMIIINELTHLTR